MSLKTQLSDKAKKRLEKEIKISQNYFINQININNLKNKLFRQKTTHNLLSKKRNEKSHLGVKKEKRPSSMNKSRKSRNGSRKQKKSRPSSKSFGVSYSSKNHNQEKGSMNKKKGSLLAKSPPSAQKNLASLFQPLDSKI